MLDLPLGDFGVMANRINPIPTDEIDDGFSMFVAQTNGAVHEPPLRLYV